MNEPQPFRPNTSDALEAALIGEHPGLALQIGESRDRIELDWIKVPSALRNQGIGSKVVRRILDYAREAGKPVVLQPQPEPRKKQALQRFYVRLGFRRNSGRRIDYELATPFGLSLVWRP